MHIRSSIGIVGYLIALVGGMMLIPALISLTYGEGVFPYLLLSALFTVGMGLVCGRYFYDKQIEFSLRDGFFIVTAGWIMMSLFGAIPFLLSSEFPTVIDVWFESVSGFTTTGSTVVQDIETLSYGILLWRSIIQWIGGMGIIVLAVSLLPLLGVGGMQLYKSEVAGPTVDKIKPRVRDAAMALWKVYLLLTLIVGILYLLGGMSWFESLCHAFTTMATGGFSTRNASIGGFDSSYINAVATIFMFIAGTGFVLHYRWLKGDYIALLKSTEFRWYAGIILTAIIFVTLSTYDSTFETIGRALEHSAFQVVSIVTTTGYGTYDYELWGPPVQFLILIFMFIGGMSGSTAGGIKIVRILLIIKNTFYETIRILHPRVIVPLTFNRERVTPNIMNEIMAFIFIFISVLVFGAITLSVTGQDFMSSVGAAASALGNIGPGFGSVGPSETYYHLHPVGKLVLTFCMIVGRLEFFTVLVIFYRWFWKG